MDDEQIFLQAIELSNPDERSAFLDQACGRNLGLRDNVESLLRHHSAAGTFLELPPAELQHTFAACLDDTVACDVPDRTQEIISAIARPGGIAHLGTYEIRQVIGQGGMGIVLRARDPKLNRDVAIKVMSAALTHNPGATQRFLREAQAAAAVKHENVVTIYSIHEDGPLPYLVMELVEGISLHQKIAASGALALEDILRIGSQIAAGLAAAHQRGVVHRDIKPANILIESDTQRAKITDFGLARVVDDANLTREGQIAGTPQFMSPEQAMGKKADQRSDLFSLGSVLYTMSTGRPAFVAETALATLRGICDDSPPTLCATNIRIPAWLDQYILQLLSKNPSDRPQTAHEVAEFLGRKLAELQSSITSPTVTVKESRTLPTQRRRSFAVATRLSIIALICVIVVTVKRNGKTTRVEVPVGATAKVNDTGEVEVTLPSAIPDTKPPMDATRLHPKLKDIADGLVKVNPEYDGVITGTVENDAMIELQFNVDHVTDLSPLATLTTLRNLACTGSSRDNGRLRDLSALRELKLESLDCSNTQVADLTPLKGMPLTRLNLNGTPVKDLSPLVGMQLVALNCANTQISDLSPLRSMPLADLHIQGTQVVDLSPLHELPLKWLNCSHTGITDISPLSGMKLQSFYCDGTRVADLSPLRDMPVKILNWRGYDPTDPRHQEVVKSITTLESINSHTVAEFWEMVEAKRKD